VKPFPIPVVSPSSSPLGATGNPIAGMDDEGLDFMPVPGPMETFHPPILPDPEAVAACTQGWAALEETVAALAEAAQGDSPSPILLNELPQADRELVSQLLGEGEVRITTTHGIVIQESVYAGVWQVRQGDEVHIEVGPLPAALLDLLPTLPSVTLPETAPDPLPEGVMNLFPVLAEIGAASAEVTPESPPHILNFTLLPMTPRDFDLLDAALGRGGVSILSKGYGNCRITRTGLRHAWWVQYFNTQDQPILNTMEVVHLPQAAQATVEDLADSRDRLTRTVREYREMIAS